MIDLNASTSAPPPDGLIKDVDEATFMADVIEASKTTPVIVDFWAPWCEPCKTLTPILEAEVTAANGKVKLAKVDIDKNQGIAQTMRIQSIPAVFAFVNGQPIDGFMGAKSGSEIKAFVAGLAGGGADDGLEAAVASAEEMLEAGDYEGAAEVFRAISQEQSDNVAAFVGLARALMGLGQSEQLRDLLDSASDAMASEPSVKALLAQMDLTEQASAVSDSGGVAEHRARAEANPKDMQARFDLALAELAAQNPQGAVEELLAIFAEARDWNEGAAKEQLLKIFESLGAESELAQSGRRRLASLIFS